MKIGRWTAVSLSEFEWEREALGFLRAHLPDHEPWRAWSNFEFVDDEGRVNEVDTLVLTPAGLVLIEIKSRPGVLRGDAYNWVWTTEGRAITIDNPLPLANRKAKRLASVLRRQEALSGKGGFRATTWIEPLIFLSAVQQQPRLDPGTLKRIALRGAPSSPEDSGVIGMLNRSDELISGRYSAVDPASTRALLRAIEQAGIRPPGRGRRIGDYELGQVLGEGENWQDFAGRHSATGVSRRVRIYPYARVDTPEARDRLARTAQREFRVLEGVEHSGIQRVLDYREAELGPALIFEFDPSFARFDRYLSQELANLAFEQRLGLIRQLGEAMAYAHGKRLYHRGLAPQSILVRNSEDNPPRLQIFNWQVASRGAGTSAGAAITAGTLHVEDHIADPARIYLSPESSFVGEEGAARVDVFSLGSIAYHILTGRPPATSQVELALRLKEGNGLLLSNAMNGARPWLEEMVRVATAPVVGDRPKDAREFLEYLAQAEEEIRPKEPAQAVSVDPAAAGPGDRLEGGFVVKRRLGQGGSAIALLVTRDGSDEELVLKVALDDAHGDRIRAEANVLHRLHHQNIVHLVEEVVAATRPAILIERAGDKTLAQWILGDETLSLDLMRRFGENLLSATEHLEQEGIAHRDIKPDNIGIAKASGLGAYRLVLFDFSLSKTPLESIGAGTRPYLDPFLSDRRPPRWDLHAERYAVAVTLHEMLTGAAPKFGDGLTDPRLTEDEATIASDRFDPALRDGLNDFFERAMKREPCERFGNAEEMIRAWREAFSAIDRAPISADSVEIIARRLHGATSIMQLGYGVEARAVLDRMGIHTVRQLLDVPRQQFRYLTGVGDRIRKEIRERAKRLAQLRPDLIPGGGGGVERVGRASIDRLGELLLPRRPAADDRVEDRILAYYLGVDEDAPEWPEAGEVAAAIGKPRSAVADALDAARDRWHKSAELNAVRNEIDALLAANGGAASADELAAQLLAARGSVEDDPLQRMRRVRGVLRAAIELEASVSTLRFEIFIEPGRPPLVARSAAAAEYARRLARVADSLAAEDPLPSPVRIEEELGLAPIPEGAAPVSPDRQLRMAAGAAKSAALSALGEIYPRGMPGEKALRLAVGALVGGESLTEDMVRARVHGRFPEAAQLPPRPKLDLLMQEHADRFWRESAAAQAGYVKRAFSETGSGAATLLRRSTIAPATEATPEVLDARAIESKIAYAAERGIFLALTVEPYHARDAKDELLRRFPRTVVSLERLMLQAMRAEAEARRVQWPKALAADATTRESSDFKNLLRLASRAAPKVREEILALREPALLTRPGLIARYDLMDMLSDFAQASGASDGPPSLWLLIPQRGQGLPQIDNEVLPVISAANWARLTEPWLANEHRAGGRAA